MRPKTKNAGKAFKKKSRKLPSSIKKKTGKRAKAFAHKIVGSPVRTSSRPKK